MRDGTEIGLLDALVMGAGNPSLVPDAYLDGDLTPFEASPDRRWQFHPRQPFHFGPNDALPGAHPVTHNHLAAVVRQQLAPGASVGAMLTSALPLEPRCLPGEFATPEQYEAASCASSGQNAASLDGIVRSSNGDWAAFGQVSASQAVGGPPEGTVLRDGTVVHPGELGYGFNFRAGKLGGEPFRFDVNGTYLSPTFDLNQTGFQQLSNYQWYDVNLHWVRPSGFGPFHSASVDYTFDAFNWSTDGKFTPRGNNHSVTAQLQLPSYDTLLFQVGLEQPQYDLREIPGADVAFERPSDAFVAAGVETDSNRPLFGTLTAAAIHIFPGGPVPSFPGWQLNSKLTWHPAPFLETYLELNGARKVMGARYLTTAPDAQTGVFGVQHPSYLSMTLRQQVVLSPRLTLQAYAQLFSGSIGYSGFYAATLPGRGGRLPLANLAPLAYPGNPTEHSSALNVNVVLRWEYRLGSTFFAVYTRSQQELSASGGQVSTSVLPARLFDGPMSQTFMLKWSYWWDV